MYKVIRKTTLAALLGLCCVALPLAADDDSSCEPQTVPEPSTLLASLLAVGTVCGAMIYRHRQQR